MLPQDLCCSHCLEIASPTYLGDFHFIQVSGTSEVALVVRNLPDSAGGVTDGRVIPGSGRSPGGEHDNALQYSCLEDPKDREAWWTTVRRIAESDMTEVT